MIKPPQNIQLIGNEIAIHWPDGNEDFFDVAFLRKHSPSAENVGEPDIFGKVHGGNPQSEYSGVTVTGWDFVGNYAIRFTFSDGHNTGIYSWKYLKELLGK